MIIELRSNAKDFFRQLNAYYYGRYSRNIAYGYDADDTNVRIINGSPGELNDNGKEEVLRFLVNATKYIREHFGDFSISMRSSDEAVKRTGDDLTIGELKKAWADRPEVTESLDRQVSVLGKRIKDIEIAKKPEKDIGYHLSGNEIRERAFFSANMNPNKIGEPIPSSNYDKAKADKVMERSREVKEEGYTPSYEEVMEYSKKSNEMFLKMALSREKKPYKASLKVVDIVKNYFILKQGVNFIQAAEEVCKNLREGALCESFYAYNVTEDKDVCAASIKLLKDNKEVEEIYFQNFGRFIAEMEIFLKDNGEADLLPVAMKHCDSLEEIE